VAEEKVGGAKVARRLGGLAGLAGL
jgi:hypothetical protein